MHKLRGAEVSKQSSRVQHTPPVPFDSDDCAGTQALRAIIPAPRRATAYGGARARELSDLRGDAMRGLLSVQVSSSECFFFFCIRLVLM